jgi:biopolymer transport protein ExbB
MGKDLAFHGQVLIYLILFCSVVSFAIIIDRFISFHKAGLNRAKFMSKLSPILKREKIIEAISLCDKYPSALTRIIKSGVLKHDRGKTKICEAMKERAQLELSQLEKYLPVLATIAYIAPLLGFLGTILGMIEIFMQLHREVGLIGPGSLAGGLGEALFTTAAGIIVAIPAILAHNYFLSRMDEIRRDSDRTMSKLADIFPEQQE